MVTQLRVITKCVMLGYCFFPPLWAHLVFVCSFIDWSLNVTKSLGKSTWHSGNSFWHLDRMPGVYQSKGWSFSFCYPFSFLYTLWHPRAMMTEAALFCSCSVSFDISYAMLKTGGCLSGSFILSWWQIQEATPPAQQRNQLDCRQLTHGQDKAPSVSLWTSFRGQKIIQIHLEEMAIEQPCSS